MTLCSSILLLTALGKQALEDHKTIRLHQLEANHYKDAWEYLYDKENKQVRKRMDTAWHKSWQGNQIDE